MQEQVDAKINAKMLKWMRESSNYTIDEIIKKSRIKKKVLEEAEENKTYLTMKQLRLLAKIYNRPLASFFLNEIPEDIQLPDFRTSFNQKVKISSELNKILRDYIEKGKFAWELFELGNYTIKNSLIGKYDENDKNEEISNYIRDILVITKNEFQNKKDNEVLNLWKEKIEALGILVFQVQKLSLRVTRGFSLSGNGIPIIVLNQKDSYYARVFTLLHELAHILLNRTGICDTKESIESNNTIEIKCNAIASLTLVPRNEFEEQINKITNIEKELKTVVESLSKKFKVSWSVILIRLKESGIISQKILAETLNYLETKHKSRKSEGGNYYNLWMSSISKKYLTMVLQQMKAERISFYDAMNYLNVSLKVMKTLEEKGDSGEL